MWGALLGVTLTGWLHQLTAIAAPDGALAGHGERDGQAMIATTPARSSCAPTGLRVARRGPRPHPRPTRHVLTGRPGPPGNTPPRRYSGHWAARPPKPRRPRSLHQSLKIIRALLADSGM